MTGLAARLAPFADLVASLDETTILVGPEGDPHRLAIDDVFGKPTNIILKEFYVDEALSRDELLPRRAELKRIFNSHHDRQGVIYLPLTGGEEGGSCGVLAFDCTARLIAGAYIGHDLGVSERYRGQGIGRQLVIERLILDGSLPEWESDKPGYSRAGVGAHRAALREMQAALRPEPPQAPEI
ncbi:GNAT family N-acetyltransferase [Palleronia sp.]|uniref:GNAT family N-acetyltransferase n=1 Tax=Palleronia sp. TaxID=1940284 RepID=UPI0035C87555